jgi:hypothetical protein
MFELFFHAITDGDRQAVECHHSPSFAFPFGRGNYKETFRNEKLKKSLSGHSGHLTPFGHLHFAASAASRHGCRTSQTSDHDGIERHHWGENHLS